MSWFKGAFDKVKEKSVIVKELAKDVAVRTKEVRSRILGTTTADELQTQLEIRAGSINSCSTLNDLLTSWISSINTDDNNRGYRYADSQDTNRSLTFTQVLLRSNAIEEMLACVVCNQTARSNIGSIWPTIRGLVKTPSFGDGETAANSLYQFVSRTISGDESVWFDLVSLLLAPHGHDDSDSPLDKFEEDVKIGNKTTADWVARCERTGFRSVELNLVHTLKRDWYSDYLELERRELAQYADTKKSDLMSTIPPNIWMRTQLSNELIDIYESIRDNLDSSTMHRSEGRKRIINRLDVAAIDVDRRREISTVSQNNAIERQSVIKKNSDITEIEFRPKLQHVMESRIKIDEKIIFFESEKRRLRIELERVSADLVTATNDQKQAMILEESIRSELRSNRVKFESMIDAELIEETESKTDFEIFSRHLVAIRNIRDRISDEFNFDSNQLNDICTQFENAFTESVQDHVTILCEAIQDIYRQIRKTSDELDGAKKNRKSHSMTQLLTSSGGGTEHHDDHEEFSASLERVDLRIAECESKLQNSIKEIEKFQENFSKFFNRFDNKVTSNRLLRGEIEKVNVIFIEADRLLKKHALVPCPVLVPASSVTVITEAAVAGRSRGIFNQAIPPPTVVGDPRNSTGVQLANAQKPIGPEEFIIADEEV